MMLDQNGVGEKEVRRMLEERGIDYLRKSDAVPAASALKLINSLNAEKRNPKLKKQHLEFAKLEMKLKTKIKERKQ